MESIPPIKNFDSYIKDILLLKITHKLETEYHGLINYTCCAIDSLSLFNLCSVLKKALFASFEALANSVNSFLASYVS